MNGLLSADDLIEMTGYKRGADQARWFREHGYYVECNARGIPRITWAQVEERRRQTSAQTPPAAAPTQPNVVAFRQKLNLNS